MSTPENTPQQLDELARKRAERESAGEPQELRDRVRADARRTARRMAAAERARRRAAATALPPGPNLPDPPGRGPAGGAA